jgi:hypothetical protein
MANRNRRSWPHCRLRLVVRYVTTICYVTSATNYSRSKATTSPPSVTATLSTRSSKTSVRLRSVRNKRLPLAIQHLLCTDQSRKHRGMLAGDHVYHSRGGSFDSKPNQTQSNDPRVRCSSVMLSFWLYSISLTLLPCRRESETRPWMPS